MRLLGPIALVFFVLLRPGPTPAAPAVSDVPAACPDFREELASGIRLFSSDPGRADAAFSKALDGARCARASTAEMLEVQLWLGRHYMRGNEHWLDKARRTFAAAVEKSRRELGDHPITGDLLMAWAQSYALAIDAASALPLAEQALAVRRRTTDPGSIGRTLVLVGSLRLDLGDRDGAIADFREAIALLRPLSPRYDEDLDDALIAFGNTSIPGGPPGSYEEYDEALRLRFEIFDAAMRRGETWGKNDAFW